MNRLALRGDSLHRRCTPEVRLLDFSIDATSTLRGGISGKKVMSVCKIIVSGDRIPTAISVCLKDFSATKKSGIDLFGAVHDESVLGGMFAERNQARVNISSHTILLGYLKAASVVNVVWGWWKRGPP